MPPSRSGFRWRLISSLALWAIMLAVVFWLPPTAMYIFMNLVIARAVWEFYRICEAKGLPTYKVWGVIGTVALVSGSWFVFGMRQSRPSADFAALSYDFDIFILLVFAIGVFIRQFPQKLNAHGIETMSVTLFGLIYVAWLGNFITRINFAVANGRFWVMYLVVVTKFTDIGAYLVGVTVGRHKMIPRISPKKTWEGTTGGLLFAVGGSFLCLWVMPDKLKADGLTIPHAIVLGVLLGSAAVIGDLAESLVKREAGVKDSSTILPGHGGCLDMVDSLLFTAPLLYVYMRLVLR
ncbi:MAG TPA: phosphatidate cytidylyltransferase [Verrucomicrobiae bacterium]|nr:phosphatidate cytidylyltransferase [Verrucomicrobiae bacterium]